MLFIKQYSILFTCVGSFPDQGILLFLLPYWSGIVTVKTYWENQFEIIYNKGILIWNLKKIASDKNIRAWTKPIHLVIRNLTFVFAHIITLDLLITWTCHTSKIKNSCLNKICPSVTLIWHALFTFKALTVCSEFYRIYLI